MNNQQKIDKNTLLSSVEYILHHVDELSTPERQQILQMLVNSSSIPDSKIQTKGGGTLIKLSHIPYSIIFMIYNYILTKLTDKSNALQSFPDEDEDEKPT